MQKPIILAQKPKKQKTKKNNISCTIAVSAGYSMRNIGFFGFFGFCARIIGFCISDIGFYWFYIDFVSKLQFESLFLAHV